MVIARIMVEGQRTLTASDIDALNALDDELSVAVETHDEEGFRNALGALLAEVRCRGTPLPDDAEEPGELILPSSDASLDDVRVMLSDSGLIPG